MSLSYAWYIHISQAPVFVWHLHALCTMYMRHVPAAVMVWHVAAPAIVWNVQAAVMVSHMYQCLLLYDRYQLWISYLLFYATHNRISDNTFLQAGDEVFQQNNDSDGESRYTNKHHDLWGSCLTNDFQLFFDILTGVRGLQKSSYWLFDSAFPRMTDSLGDFLLIFPCHIERISMGLFCSP